MSIAELLRHAGERHGSATALVDAARTVSFADLWTEVLAVAAGLPVHGLGPGSRVLVLLGNRVESVVVDLALTIGGQVRVALNPRMQVADWLRIAADCDPEALVLDPGLPGALDLATRVLAHRRGTRLITVDGAGRGRDHHLPHVTTLAELVAAGPEDRVLPEPAPSDLCGLHYSSGTTGRPKGAERTHANRLASLTAMNRHVLDGTLEGPPPVFLHAGPVIHTSGLFVLPFLALGGRQVLLEGPRPTDLGALIERHEATHTVLVPTVIARLLDLDDADLAPWRRLRMLAYAGAPMPVSHIRAAHRRITPNLVQYYGLVEAIPPLTVLGVAAHARALADGDESTLASVGRPCDGVEVAIRAQGRILPRGSIGEVVVGGAAVSPGYHAAQGRTDLGKAHVDGHLHTGDLGFLDAAGRLHLTGRRTDLIITGGYNVQPREVEEVLAFVPGVHDVVVVGVPDPSWGQRLVAAYSVSGDRDVAPQALMEAARSRLPDYKRPKAVHRVEALPLTPLGKVDRVRTLALLTDLTAAAESHHPGPHDGPDPSDRSVHPDPSP